MWLDRETKSAFFKAFLSAFWMSSLFFSSGAYAVAIPDLSAMLISASQSIPNLMQLVTGGAYVLGMFFVIASVMGMKHFGEMRTMMSQEHSVSGPLVEFFVGIAMLYLPSAVQTSLSTFWAGGTNPIAYLDATEGQYTTFVNACYAMMDLIGTIAFIRGLIILKAAGSGKSQQGSLGKALAHIIGGILCINLYNTIQVLEVTVGMTPGWTSTSSIISSLTS